MLKHWYKKMGISALAMVCALAVLMAGMPFSVASAAGTEAATTEYLNLRSGAGTNYKVLLTLVKGAVVTVTDDSNSQWAKVTTKSGKQGYCSKQYLKYSGSSSSAAPSSVTGVTTVALNLRKGAGTGYGILTTMKKGAAVTVLDNSNATWVKVRYGSLQGYCSRDYLKLSGGSGSSSGGGSSGGSSVSGQKAVTTEYVNLRKGAGTNYAVLFTMAKGASVTILENTNSEWAKVQTASGRQGYCSRQYLKVEDSSGGNTPEPEDPTEKLTAVTTAALNLRKGAGTNYGILVTMKNGSTVTVLDNSNATWVKVRYGSLQGYCSREYLKFPTGGDSDTPKPDPIPDPAPSEKVTAVTTAALNLRKGAGTKYGILTTMKKGSTITVLDNAESDWVHVQYGSLQGYCSREYLDIKKENGSGGGNSDNTDPSRATTNEYVNLRKGPGTNYNVIVTLMKGVQVTVLDTSHTGWVKVRTSTGKEGYCSRQYLDMKEEPVDPPTPGSSGSSSEDSSSNPDSSESSGSSEPESSTPERTPVSIVVTASSVLRLREQPNTTSKVLAALSNGAKADILDASNSEWIKVKTKSGLVGYVSAEYVQIIYSDDQGIPASSLSLSHGSGTIPLGKTYYIKANVSPKNADVKWISSNPGVAAVEDGLILAVGKGTAVITAQSGSLKSECKVTVTDAEPVKTAYATPNIASKGQTVTLVALTDTARSGVKFLLTAPSGAQQTVTASGSTADGSKNLRWEARAELNETGNYKVNVVSARNGSYSSSGFTTSAFVVEDVSDFTVSTSEERRASDKIVKQIASWEGFSSTVYADTLPTNPVPTIGHGFTFGVGAVFYNGITREEAYSQLVNSLNQSSYTSEVNKFIRNNKLLMNQNQADALISFGYNIGAGYWNGSSETGLRTVILNAVVPPDVTGGKGAKVTKATVLRAEPSMNAASVRNVANSTAVTVVETSFKNTRGGWYKVTLSGGETGWLNAGYVRFNDSASLTHDLNYTNAYALGTEMLRWCSAGGNIYAGLVYRRMGEANIYNYNDYNSENFKKNIYGYTYPAGYTPKN